MDERKNKVAALIRSRHEGERRGLVVEMEAHESS